MHITNGDGFTTRLHEINPPGTIFTWREMLCEGPVSLDVFEDDFVAQRVSFLSNYTADQTVASRYESMAFTFRTLDFNNYNSIVLWFEYDLFCHINLAAAVYFFTKRHAQLPIFLVCSGTVEGIQKLFALGELTKQQILEEAENRQLLGPAEISALCKFWECYASDNQNAMLDIPFNENKLPYLKSCIVAHLERFPKKSNGLNALEEMLLIAIKKHKFISERQVVGYILKNQGYYGFGDLQWERILVRLRPFFTELLELELNEQGDALVDKRDNAFQQLKDNTQFGGTLKYDYFYNSDTQQLTLVHAT